MVKKNKKKLYKLIFTLNLTLTSIFSIEKNSNEIQIEYNKNDQADYDALEISFKEYEPIISKIMQLFEDAIEISREKSDITDKELAKIFEELDFNKVQGVVLKYVNNVKKNKKSETLDPITLNDLKMFLDLLYHFILKVEPAAEILDISTINSIEEINIVLNKLMEKNNNIKRSIIKANQNESKLVIEGVVDTLERMTILIKNILSNITKGKYLSDNLYNNIFHPGTKHKSKNNIRIIEYQNEIILPLLQECNSRLQKNQLLLHEVINLEGEISEKKLKMIYDDVMYEVLHTLAMVQYFLEESKFYPKNKKFVIENKQVIALEIENIQKKTKEYYNKIIKNNKFNTTTKALNFNVKELLSNMQIIKKIITNSIDAELKLTLFAIQNIYRDGVFALEKLGNLNDVTKLFAKYTQPTYWSAILATVMATDFYLWLKDYKTFGAVQILAKTISDGYHFIQRGGKSEVPLVNNLSESPSIRLMKEAIKANLNAENGNNLLNDVKAQYPQFVNITDLTELSKIFNDENYKTILSSKNIRILNSTVESREWLNLYDKLIQEDVDFVKEVEELEKINAQVSKIAPLIRPDIINSFNREEKLKERCKANNITNLNGLDKIITVLGDKQLALENKKNKMLNTHFAEREIKGLGDTIGNNLGHIPCGHIVGATTIGFAAKMGEDWLIEKGYVSYLKYIWTKFHYFMMGESYNSNDKTSETINVDTSSFAHDIYDPTFDVLDQQGVLVWFKEVVSFIEASCSGKPYSGSEKISKCIGLFGPSGSGKTYLARALANHIDKITKEYKTNVKVQFLAIDPKYFNGIIHNGQTTKVDVIQELSTVLEEIRLQGGFYIIHFDEFHLFFTKDGKINQERLADLLKFFNDLFVKQKNYKRIGGMYVICSTNKPQFIPHEFFDNGDRIGEIYEIKYPNGEQIISILKKELSDNNVILNHIDFDYFMSLMQGYNLTYGTIVKIANKAFNIAKIKNRIIDNEILYYAINDVVRKIILNDFESNKYLKDSKVQNNTAAYYSALAAVVINFNHENNNIYDLDMVTILPLKQNFAPQHTDRLYLKPEVEAVKFGEAFYAKANCNNVYNPATIAVEIIKAIAPTIYLDSQKMSKINQQNELAAIYDILYRYFASKLEYVDCAKRLDTANQKRTLSQDINIDDFTDQYNHPILHKRILDILKYAEKLLLEYYQNQEVKDLMEEINQLLKEKKIVTKKDILSNSTCEVLIKNINILFEKLLSDISNQLV